MNGQQPTGMIYRYMGAHPELPYTINDTRIADTLNGHQIINRPPTLPMTVTLRWAVAVAHCPYCDQHHEHLMSRASGWGWYRAPCDGARSYYLVPPVPQ